MTIPSFSVLQSCPDQPCIFVQDVVTRYAHQSGFHVDRRFGWDCHGLPVEYEIDKTIGIKSPEDVKKMGVAAYNAECRKIVMRYSKEWEVGLGGH